MGISELITPSVKQWWCASGVLICVMGQGIMLGYTASLLPALQAADSPIKVDIGMSSWLASIMGPAIFIGTALSCFWMDLLGRRKANLLSIIPGIVGWIMIYLADSYLIIFIGRVLTALTFGAVCTVGIVMFGEYTSPENRGMFLNLKTTAVSLGSAVSHILGNFMHWRSIALVALIPHVVAIAIGLTWPESPSWLATRKQYDKCEKEFFWLRGVTEKSTQEATELIKSQQARYSKPKKGMKLKIIEFFKKIIMKDFLKPLFIVIVACCVLESCGRHFFPAYAMDIMNKAIDSKIPVHYYTLCIDIVVTVTTVGASVLIRMINVRTLLFTSGIGTLVVLLFLCPFLYLTSIGVVSNYPWVITSLFGLFFIFGNLGCTPVPLAIQGELFPLAHREIGIFVTGIFGSICLTATLKVIPYLLLTLDAYGTFAVFGVILAIALVILYFTLPETKDKTLQEIENYFKFGKYRINDDTSDVYLKMLTK